MDSHFELFHNRLKLTKNQRDDAKSKYSGVSRSLYAEFYEGDYDKKTRLIFGSYGKKTQSRHPIGDIDLMFKISKADLDKYQAYTSNGPSALLDRARTKLKQTYTTTDKIASWGKVVLVQFADGKHDIEVLPGYEQTDGTFIIPNSEDGGSWDVFDPRAEMRMVKDSNDVTNGITRKLIKFIKRWRNKADAPIKSFQIEYFCVSYLDTSYSPDKTWPEIVEGFFAWLELQGADLKDEAVTKTITAKNRVQKARDYEINDDNKNACIEWRKVFGQVFPVYDPDLATINRLEKQYVSASEEHIHERFPVKIDRRITMEIIPKMKRNGFRDFELLSNYFSSAVRYLPKQASLVFDIKSSLGATANYYWKIRNLSDEAEQEDGLRGEIHKDKGRRTREESTKYNGIHYVECYAIVAGVCVASVRRFVPIMEETA